MIIDRDNLYEFDSLYWHDSVFLGFHFDYEKRTISLVCSNLNTKKQKRVSFKNVIALQMQCCEFWGEENRIYDAWVDTEHMYYSQLMKIQEENKDKYIFSRLDSEITYISIEIQLISGDEVMISCETIEITEE